MCMPVLVLKGARDNPSFVAKIQLVACELPDVGTEPGLLEQQRVPLTMKPSFQPQHSVSCEQYFHSLSLVANFPFLGAQLGTLQYGTKLPEQHCQSPVQVRRLGTRDIWCPFVFILTKCTISLEFGQ